MYAIRSYYDDAWALSSADGHYGQILASRFPLAAPEIHDISAPGREPRKVIGDALGGIAPHQRRELGVVRIRQVVHSYNFV